MKTLIQNIWQYVKNHIKILVFFIIVIVLAVFLFGRDSNNNVKNITVIKTDLAQEVAVTGKTKPNKSVDLAFETSGKVQGVKFSVGDSVSAGEVLAVLDQSQLLANLARSKADLSQEQIRLDQISKQSSNTYSNARSSMIASIRDAYIKTDDAVRNNVDQFFYRNSIQAKAFIDFSFIDGTYQYNPVLDSGLSQSINSSRDALESSLNKWQLSITALSNAEDLTPYVVEAEKNLNDARIFLGQVAEAVNSLPPTDFSHTSTIAGYRATVSSARANVSSALSNLVIAKDKLNSAPKETQSNTGAQGFDEVLAQQSRVAQFEAEVKSKEALLAKTVLVSPISGIITKFDAKKGEIVNAGASLISVISNNDLLIEADVSEVNIGKVKIGNDVSITFDAYPNKSFVGKVIYVDPGATIVDGVVNYKLTITFDQGDEKVKSGLTSNLVIKTAIKPVVLNIPQYAITEEDDVLYVMKLVNNELVKTTVTTGFIGNNGSVEVLSGLSEDDVIQVGEK